LSFWLTRVAPPSFLQSCTTFPYARSSPGHYRRFFFPPQPPPPLPLATHLGTGRCLALGVFFCLVIIDFLLFVGDRTPHYAWGLFLLPPPPGSSFCQSYGCCLCPLILFRPSSPHPHLVTGPSPSAAQAAALCEDIRPTLV